MHDDAPIVTGSTITSQSIGETTTEVTQLFDLSNAFTVQAGADGLKEGTGSYSLNITNANTGLTAIIKNVDEDKNVTLTEGAITLVEDPDDPGHVIGKAGDVEVFHINITADGKVNMYMTGKGTIKHGKDDDTTATLPLKGLQGVYTVEDTDGDHASGSIDLGININDTIAVGTPGEASVYTVPGTSLTLNFMGGTTSGSTVAAFKPVLESQDDNWKNPTRGPNADNAYNQIKGNNTDVHYILVNGIRVIATHVQYNTTDDGHIYNLVDINSGNGLSGNKALYITGNGIGVGPNSGDDDAGQMATKPDITGYDKNTGVKPDGLAEAIVLEPQNSSVWYELNLTLTNFDGNDRAMVYFYMTPQNSNDNNIAYARELTVKDIDPNTGTYRIEVPDGFTKAIVVAMPDTEGKASSFNIGKVDFSKNAIEHHMNAVVDASAADGVSSIVWDWSEFANQVGEKVGDNVYLIRDVTISDTIGSGKYDVTLTWTGNTVTAKLSGNMPGTNTPLPQGSDTLFKGTLDAKTGAWSIDQFYKFEIGKNIDSFDESKMNFLINVTDGDGDVTPVPSTVDMHIDVTFDRFQNVEIGYWNSAWDGNAAYDKVSDILMGKDQNDLMYGKGGNDLMFGDSTGATGNQFVQALTGNDNATLLVNNIPLDKVYDDYAEKAIIGENWTNGGDANQYNVQEVWTALENLANQTNEDGTPADGSQFDAVLAAVEKGAAAGDDALFGGLGNDMLFGGSGDDYLVGGNGYFADDKKMTDENMLFGGSGDDIIVYGKDDLVIHGGDGIDVLLVSKDVKDSLATIQQNAGSGPKVYQMEVLLRYKDGVDVQKLGITSHSTLAKDYGIEINGDENSIVLSSVWKQIGTTNVYEAQINGNNVEVELAGQYTLQSTDKDGKQHFADPNKVKADAPVTRSRAMQQETLENLPEDTLARLGRAYDINTAATAAAIAAQLAVAIDADPVRAAEVINAEPAMATDSNVVPMSADAQVVDADVTDAANMENMAANAQTMESVADANAGTDHAGVNNPQVENVAAIADKVDADQDDANQTDRSRAASGDETGEAKNEIHGTDGDDVLIGTDADEIIFGGAGNDFIDGRGGSDTIFAGEGDDLIVYDASDYLIDGGEGIDVLLGRDGDPSLKDMLSNEAGEGPVVKDVEVLIKGADALSLTSMDDLASEYGIVIDHEKGTMTLGDKWHVKGTETDKDTGTTFTTYENGDGLTLETTLPQMEAASADSEALNTAVHTLANSNG